MQRALGLLLVILLGACSTSPVETISSVEPYVYKVGAGDRLRITVFGEPSLTGEFAIDGTGAIAFPLLGPVSVSAKTTALVRDEITSRLGAEFVRNPKVSVEVANYRPVYVLGEVARPGEFPYVEGLTALALVAKAGGFTYRANEKVIFVRHEAKTAEQIYALTGGLVIRPGDTVRVGERYF
jgi:polysaccharide biosynthesis/export protein